jgi:hypothetical protein
MRRGRQQKNFALVNTLGDALRFVALAQRKEGNDPDTHCRMFNKWAVATNGVLTAGTPIQDDIQTCPHTHALLAAMDQCTGPFALAQMAPDALSVRSGEFQAVIPCVGQDRLPALAPDNPCGLCDNRLIAALELVAPLVADNSITLLLASIQLRGPSVVATDREIVMEAWHGIDMPGNPPLLIPKSAATALAKCGKDIIKFGYSAESITFWLHDGSWLKSQLFTEWKLPDVMQYFNLPCNPWPLPKGFFEAVEKLAPFSTDGFIYCKNDTMLTDKADIILAANMHVPGVPDDMRFKLKNLNFIAKLTSRADFRASEHAALFFGDNVRAAISVTHDSVDSANDDEDIPF